MHTVDSIEYRFAMYKWNINSNSTQQQNITFTFNNFSVAPSGLKIANNKLVIDSDNKPLLIQYRIVESGILTPTNNRANITTNWLDATTTANGFSLSNYDDDTTGTASLRGGLYLDTSSITYSASGLTSIKVYTPAIQNKNATVYLRIGLPMTGSSGTLLTFSGVQARF
jgi:hypothetical protein